MRTMRKKNKTAHQLAMEALKHAEKALRTMDIIIQKLKEAGKIP